MYKLLLPLILIFVLSGCDGCDGKPMFKIGQKVCILDMEYPYPIGEIYQIDGYTYYVKIYKPELKGHIIFERCLRQVSEFIPDPR